MMPLPGGGLAEGRARYHAAQRAEREAGIAWARAWRVRNRPYFEALFGPDAATAFCPRCGRRR
jgi:hypothetical protein